mmetsp:Transcript_16154/g.30761  ORF Transcript_16154/g.30761 Transcript_16154/m.30761 type:complete len:247 (-) Transcript_16154:1061-1801(-)|eukprot:scaffold5139_cov155-Amphora_coffeaeformis.AAC.4
MIPNESQPGSDNEDHIMLVNNKHDASENATPSPSLVAEEEPHLKAPDGTATTTVETPPDVKPSDDPSLSVKPPCPILSSQYASIRPQDEVVTAALTAQQPPRRSVSFGNPNPNLESSSSSHHPQNDVVSTGDHDLPKHYRRTSSMESQRALQSFRQLLSRMDNDPRNQRRHVTTIATGGPLPSVSSSDRWRPWASWSLPRLRQTSIGVVSSILVLTVRLYLDPTPTVYLIHSIVVFFDMVLIHVFT